MPRNDGKGKFLKYLLDEGLITEEEFRIYLWYIREVRDKIEQVDSTMEIE